MLEQPTFEGIYDETPKRKKNSSKKSDNNKDKRIKAKNIESDVRKGEDKKVTTSYSSKKKKKFVNIANDCCYLRDNPVGLYCRIGTRKVRRLKNGNKTDIVCLDCDESGKPSREVTDAVYLRLEERKRNG